MGGSQQSRMTSLIAYNVRSLSAKLSALLSWPVSLFLLSEVRVATPRQRSLSRVLSGQRCSVVWGVAPPPSPTFSVSPGGVAVIAKQPWVARSFPIPALVKWSALGRVVTAKVTHPTCGEVLCISVYGFPESHPSRSMNEHMLKDIIAVMASVTMPIYMGGDLNVSLHSSEALSLCESMGVVCVSPTNTPTTMARSGDPSGTLPIDFIFANMKARDMVCKSRVNHAITLSDHYPVELQFGIPRHRFLVTKWPSTVRLGAKQREDIPFPTLHESTTYRQWQKIVTRWLSVSFAMRIPPKHAVRTVKYRPPRLPQDVVYRQLLSLQSALQHVITHGETLQRKRSIARKRLALPPYLKVNDTSYVAMKGEVHQCILDHVKSKQKDTLSAWIQKARLWKASSKEACSFVKNPEPCKVTVVSTPKGATVDPAEVHKHLVEYWASIETWPEGQNAQQICDMFDDKYSMFLPRMEFHAPFTCDLLHKAAKAMGDSSPGLDAWTTREVKNLPPQAWIQFLHIILNRPHELESELITLVKRVPLEKRDGLCAPADIRPIDLFSVLLRLASTATYNLVRPWSHGVLHPNQHATSQGALHAAAKIAWRSEQSWAKLLPTHVVACDFTKMFNMLSIEVATQAAVVMGLSSTLANILTLPLRLSAFTWKLPFGAKALETKPERGLPQGMAGSVLMAELIISALLWKCQLVLNSDPQSLVVAYVDNLNFFLADPGVMKRILDIVFEFTADLALCLSLDKTKLVGHDLETLRKLGSEHGIAASTTLHALGAEWPMHTAAKPTYSKEEKRMEELERRLLRAKNLPLSFAAFVDTVSTACLSLLDYINHPKITRAKAMRSVVKKTLGHYHAAPEILFNSFLSTSLDPCIRWLLAIARMWHMVLQQPVQPDHVEAIKRRTQSRLGSGAITLAKHNVLLGCEGFLLSEQHYPRSIPWGVFRRCLLDHLKRQEYVALAARRPTYFGGLETCAVKAHRKLLRSLSPYDQSTLVRIWTGAVMTRAKNSQMYGTDPTCQCGEAEQDMEHLLWNCPLSSPPSPSFAYRAALVPSQSLAHILPVSSSPEETSQWRQSCKRAIAIVNGQARGERTARRERDVEEEVRDTKGHHIATTADGLYVYCVKCFIARCSRDAKWIFTKPCPHSMREPLVEGQSIEDHGHKCTLHMTTWKLSSQRPQLRCSECGNTTWATSGFRRVCRGVR